MPEIKSLFVTRLYHAKLAELGVNVSGGAQSAPSSIPLRSITEAPPQTDQPFQRVPEIKDRMPDQQGDQVFKNRQPIFDDDPVPPPSNGAGRVRL